MFDCISTCILDGGDHIERFKEVGGYKTLIANWLKKKRTRFEAIKLLGRLMTVAPPSHSLYMIKETEVLSMVFPLLMKTDESQIRKATSRQRSQPSSSSEVADCLKSLLISIWELIKSVLGSDDAISLDRVCFKLLENNL